MKEPMKESRKERRGASLVELLVVMSLGAGLLTTSAVVLHRIMHAHGKTRHFLAASRSSLRLADQFRSDVHRARKVTTDDLTESIFVRLELNEANVVEYSHMAGMVRRTQVTQDEATSREEYAFPASSKLTVREQTSPHLVTLSITCTPGDARGPAQQGFATAIHLQIEAQVGRDSRYIDVDAEAQP